MSHDNNTITKKVTDYTVINNILTTTNNNVSMDCATAQYTNDLDASRESLRSSFEEKNLQVVEGGSNATRQNAILPHPWQWVKVDLFDNSKNHKPRHKLSVSICKSGEIQRYRSLNNSPFALFKRGFVDYNNDPHYNFVKSTYHELKQQEYKPQVSKCFTRGYGGKIHDTVFGLSTILCAENRAHRYTVGLVAEEQVIWVPLSGEVGRLSEAQRQKNIIVTGSIMQPRKTIWWSQSKRYTVLI